MRLLQPSRATIGDKADATKLSRPASAAATLLWLINLDSFDEIIRQRIEILWQFKFMTIPLISRRSSTILVLD